MTGEDWNQPPEGVAEIMLPQRSITSTWVVSPRRADAAAPAGATTAGAAPGSVTLDRRRKVSITRSTWASKPARRPGDSSCDACSPISRRRAAL